MMPCLSIHVIHVQLHWIPDGTGMISLAGIEVASWVTQAQPLKKGSLFPTPSIESWLLQLQPTTWGSRRQAEAKYATGSVPLLAVACVCSQSSTVISHHRLGQRLSLFSSALMPKMSPREVRRNYGYGGCPTALPVLPDPEGKKRMTGGFHMVSTWLFGVLAPYGGIGLAGDLVLPGAN